MGRFVNPKSLRYGELGDWNRVSESGLGYLQVKAYLDYVERVLKTYLYKKEGVIVNRIELERNVLSIELYDRVLELSLREQEKRDENLVEKLVGKKILIVKRLLISEGYKYFGGSISVEFKYVEFKGLTATGLSRYIGYNLLVGYSIIEILRLVSMEYRDNNKGEGKGVMYDLTHKEERVYVDTKKIFKGIEAYQKELLGFRVDVAGRYSRKQRASRKSYGEGTVPLNSYKGYMDYGMSVATLDYGSCSIRAWLYYDRPGIAKGYICTIK